MTEQTWLVVGLGNPGPKYAGNRHNVGQMVLDELANRCSASFSAHKGVALVARGRLGGTVGVDAPTVLLAKPSSYMNLSGGPVLAVAKYYSVPIDRLVVVHDELDVPFASVRLKFGGGEGGHNGLRDITRAFGTRDYLRVRVGVGRPPGRMDAADYVLRDFASTERSELPFLIDDAADATELLIQRGLVDAQQQVHQPKS